MQPFTLRIIALLLVAVASRATAQVVSPLAVRLSDNPVAAVPSPASPTRSPYEMPGRVLLGLGGAVLGAMSGGLIGATYLYDGKCACEDPGLEEALVGAAVGSVLASAMLAAVPDFSSTCSIFQRVGLGVAGSVVGAIAGGALGAAMGEVGVPLGYMGGAGVGGGLATAACRR